MNNKQKLSSYVILTIITIFVALVGTAYAYFAGTDSNNANISLSTNIANKSYSFASYTDETMNLDVSAGNMTEGGVGTVASSDSANLTVRLNGVSDTDQVYCTYNVVYVWDSETKYTTPDKTLGANEFEYSIKETNENKLSETDISNLTFNGNEAVLFTDHISSYSSTIQTEKVYTFTTSIYNINALQANIKGKTFLSHIIVKDVACGINTLTNLTAPTITNSAITVGNNSTLEATTTNDKSTLKDVMVDTDVLSENEYTVSSGSTIVTVKASYLDTLENGTHTLSVISTEGIAQSTFTISGNFSISQTITNATSDKNNSKVISDGKSIVLKYTFDGTNYIAPSTTPTVTGATSTYNRISDTECTITLTNPTDDVVISFAAEQIVSVPGGSVLVVYDFDNCWPYTLSSFDINLYRKDSLSADKDEPSTTVVKHTFTSNDDEVKSSYEIIDASSLLNASGSKLIIKAGSWYDVSGSINYYIYSTGSKTFSQSDITAFRNNTANEKTTPDYTVYNPDFDIYWHDFSTNMTFAGFNYEFNSNTVIVIALDLYSED